MRRSRSRRPTSSARTAEPALAAPHDQRRATRSLARPPSASSSPSCSPTSRARPGWPTGSTRSVLREVLQRYFDAMRAEIEAEGGTVEKFIGDAVMAVFGVPIVARGRPLPRGARRARHAAPARPGQRRRSHARTASSLRDADRRQHRRGARGDQTRARRGDGHRRRRQRRRAAADLGRAGRGARLRADRAGRARLRLRRPRRARPAGQARAGTRVPPSPAWSAAPTRGVPYLRAPMVGRDAELDVLQRVLRAAVDGGPAARRHGLRRRRRRQEPAACASSSPVCRTRAAAAGAARPLPAVRRRRDLLAARRDPQGPRRRQGHRHRREARSHEIRPSSRDLLDAIRRRPTHPSHRGARSRTPSASTDPTAPTAGVRPAGGAAARCTRRGARSSPRWPRTARCVLVVEDIHWADPALLDLLEELGERAHGAGAVRLSRRDPTWSRRDRAGAVAGATPSPCRSTRWPPAEAEHARAPAARPSTTCRARCTPRILERAEGNPFFLEEILRRLIDGGLVVRDDDRWRASPGIEAGRAPRLGAGRAGLAHRPARPRRQAGAAGRRGRRPGLLDRAARSCCAGSGTTLDAGSTTACAGWRSASWCSPGVGSSFAGQPEYIFKHILTRDVAYDGIPRREPRAPRTRSRRALARAHDRRAGRRVRRAARPPLRHGRRARSRGRHRGRRAACARAAWTLAAAGVDRRALPVRARQGAAAGRAGPGPGRRRRRTVRVADRARRGVRRGLARRLGVEVPARGGAGRGRVAGHLRRSTPQR